MEKKTEFLSGEYWYVGIVNDGFRFPLSAEDVYYADFTYNDSYNQMNPVCLSTKGRYIWADGGSVSFCNGEITVRGDSAAICSGGNTLRDACLAAGKAYYPASGRMPNRVAFEKPQYCTWIALGENQNQEGVIRFAESIVANGLPPGLMILDDTWQEDYGMWEFCKKFPDPLAMTERLHELGFTVSLWVVPYVSSDSPAYRKLKSMDVLLKDDAGEIVMAEWWQGVSAVLDLRKEQARNWMESGLRRLSRKYGIDGFKFDGGDGQYIIGGSADANRLNELWCEFYDCDLLELRACYKSAGRPLVYRIADRAHAWGVNYIYDTACSADTFTRAGLKTLIPNLTLQGLAGYPFGCPDMVGGGLLNTFSGEPDEELLARSCQVSALMPMIQFSYPLWEKSAALKQIVLSALELRRKMSGEILRLAEQAASTGAPIVRPLAYEFPDAGLEKIDDQFMLGEKWMVCPVTCQHADSRRVILPEGKWRSLSGIEYDGGRTIDWKGEKEEIPVFERTA